MTVANMDPAPLRVTLQSHIVDHFMGHTLAISGKLWGGSPLSFAKDRPKRCPIQVVDDKNPTNG